MHACVLKAFSKCPQNDFIFKCYLIHLKNNSTPMYACKAMLCRGL